MTARVPTRQPFASLDSSRLQSLANAKNRQNAIPTSFSSPIKPTLSSPVKRPFAPSFDDDFDSENIDPSLFSSPTKRSKNIDGTPNKSSKFVLSDTSLSTTKSTPLAVSSPRLPSTTSPIGQKRKTLSVSTANTTPISHSRGSPKHKRVGLLSKRRTSSSPFRRIDPPSFSHGNALRHAGAGLPFSIDAALSGTISTYTPKAQLAAPESAAVEPVLGAKPDPTVEEAMPKSWFFDIHEDTPEEEAANLMEHSTCVLDISSDDDSDIKRRAEEREQGKENIPPPDWVALAASRVAADGSIVELSPAERKAGQAKSSKPRRFLLAGPDAMVDDRSPLGDLPAKDFYPEGLNADSVVIVDAAAPQKPSGLSQDTKFDFETPVEVWDSAIVVEQPCAEKKDITIWTDDTADAAAVVNVVAETAV